MEKIYFKDLIQKSIAELVAMRNEARKYLYDLKIKNNLRNLKQTHLIKFARNNLARLNTALHFKTNIKDGNNLK